MEILVMLTSQWVSIAKPLNIMIKDLTSATEISDQGGEARAYHNIGNVYFSIEQF